MASLAEGFSLAEKAGLDQYMLLEILNLSPVACPMVDAKGSAILEVGVDNCKDYLCNALDSASSFLNPINLQYSIPPQHVRRIGRSRSQGRFSRHCAEQQFSSIRQRSCWLLRNVIL